VIGDFEEIVDSNGLRAYHGKNVFAVVAGSFIWGNHEVRSQRTRMRFGVGPVLPDDSFNPDSGEWIRFREPGDRSFMATGIVTGIVIAVILGKVLTWIDPEGSRFSTGQAGPTLPFILGIGAASIGGILTLIAVHEVLHLIIHPGQGRSRQSVLGVLPRYLVFYASYTGEMSRTRYLFILAFPFLVLTVFPVAVFAFTAEVNIVIGLVAITNGLGSGVDLIMATLVFRQLPMRSLLRFHGWELYWKPNSAE